MKLRDLRHRRLSYKNQKALIGLCLIMPWFIGSIWFFIIPFFESFLFSFQNVSLGEGGMITEMVGFEHYEKLFTGDPEFLGILQNTLSSIWYEIILVIVLSCFLAVLLNGKYKGRIVVRGIFFLPVIIASGVVMSVFSQSGATSEMLSGSRQTSMFEGVVFTEVLAQIGLPEDVVAMIGEIISRLFTLVWKSGVQTILLLAGLQSVPKTSYEAAQVEGATAWEMFWKITFPLLSPTLVLCSFYTVIDLANDRSQLIVDYVYRYSTKLNYGYSSAIANIWFVIILICVGAIFLISRRHVFYMEDVG